MQNNGMVSVPFPNPSATISEAFTGLTIVAVYSQVLLKKGPVCVPLILFKKNAFGPFWLATKQSNDNDDSICKGNK